MSPQAVKKAPSQEVPVYEVQVEFDGTSWYAHSITPADEGLALKDIPAGFSEEGFVPKAVRALQKLADDPHSEGLPQKFKVVFHFPPRGTHQRLSQSAVIKRVDIPYPPRKYPPTKDPG